MQSSIDTDADVFKHKPLDQAQKTLRIARFRYLKRECKIEFTVVERALPHVEYYGDPKPSVKYTAVSYVWGPPEPSFAIFEVKTGKKIFIRQNLYDYLLDRGRKGWLGPNKWFWMDQVCIDQSSIEDRNYQVSLMDNIFRQASEVDVWLVSWLVSKQVDNDSSGLPSNTVDIQWSRNGAVSAPWTQNVYWSRLWILQEVILANWFRINLDGEQVMLNFGNITDHLPTTVSPAISWMHSCRQKKQGRMTSLFACYSISATTHCTDPRDKIFGVQSLLWFRDRTDIDYTKTTRQVFLEGVTMLLLRSEDTAIDQLSFCIDALGRSMNVVRDGIASELRRGLETSGIRDVENKRNIKKDSDEFENLVLLLEETLKDVLLP